MAQVLGDAVAQPPTDGITRVRFSQTQDVLLASSWDCGTRVYDAPSGSIRCNFTQDAPVLDCCFQQGDQHIYTGSLDGQLRQIDAYTGQQTSLGAHAGAVKCVEWLSMRGLVLTASWDQTMRLWDPRAAPGQNCVASISLPGKAYTVSLGPKYALVGTSGRHVLVFDISRLEMGVPEQQRESSLKYQTRALAAFPDGAGYALGSVEGRVAMEYIDMSPQAQANKYAFKCHRQTLDGCDTVYPVNAIAFHPHYGTFATGGADGVVNLWDGSNKKRLFQISSYPTSVSSLAFSRDGSLMAVASSYSFEFGDQPHPADQLYVRRMQDVEIRPKPRVK